MLTRENYLSNLLEQIPEFLPVYEEHIADNRDVLHYVLMGELFDFASSAYARREIILLARIVDFVNQLAISGDDDLRELVHVSFIEDVPYSPVDDAIRPLLNDTALDMYQAVVNFEPAL